MPDYLVLLAPSSNRVYAGSAPSVTAAELGVVAEGVGYGAGLVARPEQVAGVSYLGANGTQLAPWVLGRLAATHAVFAREGELLRPVPVDRGDLLDDDLLTIPKYAGKTNEQFTRTLLGVTLASTAWAAAFLRSPEVGVRRARVLDPLAGRGTTLSAALALGHEAYGVERDRREVEAYSTFLRTWLRRKRLKHSIELRPLRRDGAHVADVLEAAVQVEVAGPRTPVTLFAADTLQTADLLGRHKVDAVVTDAPYGVVHGAHTGRGRPGRSPAELLADAVPVWSSVLRRGGAMGIAWNTHGLSRDDLARICADSGLVVRDEPPYLGFAHRVDAGIRRDILVAVKPTTAP